MHSFGDLLHAWCRAEASGDSRVVAALLADDFRGDSARGYVLDRRGWLDRLRSGAPIDWRLAEAHSTLDIAVAIGTCRGASGERACTVVGVRRGGRWWLVNVQIGQVVDVPTRPPGDASGISTSAKESPTMTNSEAPQAQQMPTPDPTLKLLDRFVGTWDMHGRTVGSDVDNVHGRASFEWLPDGFFLQQRIKLDFAGLAIEGLEVIGYDPATGTFPSTVYPNMAPMAIPYRWEIDGDNLTITTEVLGAIFRGRWSDDGTTFSGGWRPLPGREGPANVSYDVSGGRAEA